MKKHKSHYHCLYHLKYHLILVTKHKKNCFTPDILARLEKIFKHLCNKWEIELLTFEGYPDHLHLVLELHPNIVPSKLINNLKTVSSRLIRKDYLEHLSQFYDKPTLWSRAYCLVSAEGASTNIFQQYIENQAHIELPT